MKKEDLIIKWLDNNLDEEELKAFKDLDAFGSLSKLDAAVQQFKAPAFDVDAQYLQLKGQQNLTAKRPQWKKYLSGVAAILVLALGLYFGYSAYNTVTYIAENSQKTPLNLPDDSEVTLNAGSQLMYQKSSWSQNREVQLTGEAFFKVTKGSTFTVMTENGTVTVLGTHFNVQSRDNHFEVTCYEGLVRVTYQNESYQVPAGKSVVVFNQTLTQETTSLVQPTWMHAESSFTSVPYKWVVQELERQYNLTINYDTVLENTIYTGSFPHKNLEAALQAITIPLKLSYQIEGNNVMLKPNSQ
ncbi:MAG: FecR domain-containing protein [Flavobacteriaceae bacterium]